MSNPQSISYKSNTLPLDHRYTILVCSM